MKEELKKDYVDGNDLFGYPQIYKGLKIYPIKIKDTKYQTLFYQLLTHPKNYIPNKDILKASYLKFLVYVIQANYNPDGTEMLDGVIDLLKYVTKRDDITVQYRETTLEGLASILLCIKIGDILYTEEDFDNIREIILEQNGSSIDYVEEYNPDLEESLAFVNRNLEGVSFQDEVFTFCAIMKLSMKEVEEYTIFQFKNAMEKVLVLKEYDLYKPLLVSGQIELKSGEIKNYLYRSVKSGRYDSIKVDVDNFRENSDVIKASQAQ